LKTRTWKVSLCLVKVFTVIALDSWSYTQQTRSTPTQSRNYLSHKSHHSRVYDEGMYFVSSDNSDADYGAVRGAKRKRFPTGERKAQGCPTSIQYRREHAAERPHVKKETYV